MWKRLHRRPAAAPLALGLGTLTAAAAIAMPNFDNWSAPSNLESMAGSSPNLNTPAVDGCASQSRDGLTLYFNSNRAGTQDIYTATRSSKDEGFGNPVALPAPVNSASKDDACPTIRPGGQLYFSSNRDDPAYDLYVSREGPNGWSTPVNLGPNINQPGLLDESAAFYEDDDGNEVMLFCRRAGPDGNIFQSINGGPTSLVGGGVNSSASDCRPSVTHDGKTIFFDSTRSGGLGGPDLYFATRSSTSQPWGTAQHLQSLSSSTFDARPFISWDGTLLTFSSARAGGAPDMWFATRDKATGN